jgi:hypothetical protein
LEVRCLQIEAGNRRNHGAAGVLRSAELDLANVRELREMVEGMNHAKGHGERRSRKEAQFSAALLTYRSGNENPSELHGKRCKTGERAENRRKSTQSTLDKIDTQHAVSRNHDMPVLVNFSYGPYARGAGRLHDRGGFRLARSLPQLGVWL